MSSPSRTRIIRRSSPSSFTSTETPRPASSFTQFEEESDDDYFPEDFVPPPERSTPLSVNRQLRPNEAVFIPATTSSATSPSRSSPSASAGMDEVTDEESVSTDEESVSTDGYASPARSTQRSSPIASEIDEDSSVPFAGAVATPLVSVPPRSPVTSPVIVEERGPSPRSATMSPRSATMSPRSATSPAATVVASYLPQPTFGQSPTLQEVLVSRGLTPIVSYTVPGVEDSVMVAVETEKGSPATIQVPVEIFEELTNTEDETLQPYEMEEIENYEDKEGEHENDEDDINIVARSLRDVNASDVCIPTSSGVCLRIDDQIVPYVLKTPNTRVSSFVGSDIPQPIISYENINNGNLSEEIDSLSAQLTVDKYQKAVATLDKISELSEKVNNYIQKKVVNIKRKLIENDEKQQQAVNKLNHIYAALAEYLDNQDIEDLKEQAKDARHKFGRLLRIAKYLEPLISRYDDLIQKLQTIREAMDQELGPFEE